MNDKKTKVSDKIADIVENIFDFIGYYSTEIRICVAIALVFTALVLCIAISKHKMETAPVYYYANEYDIEAMARELGIEPEYEECGPHVPYDYISSACDENGNYTYHYVIFVSDDAVYNTAQKYRLADTTATDSETEDDDT